jgi:hypothetical protein
MDSHSFFNAVNESSKEIILESKTLIALVNDEALSEESLSEAALSIHDKVDRLVQVIFQKSEEKRDAWEIFADAAESFKTAISELAVGAKVRLFVE